METGTYTGEEFIKALSEGRLKEPITRIGMVKTHEHAADTILFAEGGSCGDWISIPAHLIAQVQFLRNVPCKDHQHPLVKITFKEPPEQDAAATLFANLARRTSGCPGGPMPGGMAEPMARSGGGIGTGSGSGGLKCISWHYQCSWVHLWIPELNWSIPIYVCQLVCDTYEP